MLNATDKVLNILSATIRVFYNRISITLIYSLKVLQSYYRVHTRLFRNICQMECYMLSSSLCIHHATEYRVQEHTVLFSFMAL